MLNQEAIMLNTYKMDVLVPASQFQYGRNCHDFAWAPFMSCCPGGISPNAPQPEAWLMDYWPNPNYYDGSMLNVVTSLANTPTCAATIKTFQ